MAVGIKKRGLVLFISNNYHLIILASLLCPGARPPGVWPQLWPRGCVEQMVQQSFSLLTIFCCLNLLHFKDLVKLHILMLIYNYLLEKFYISTMGHFIPSGPPMDGKFSYCDKNLVCYVYKCKKLLFKSTFG